MWCWGVQKRHSSVLTAGSVSAPLQPWVLAASFMSVDVLKLLFQLKYVHICAKAAWQVIVLPRAQCWASCCGGKCRSIQRSPWRSVQRWLGVRITVRQLEKKQSMKYWPVSKRTQIKERDAHPSLIRSCPPTPQASRGRWCHTAQACCHSYSGAWGSILYNDGDSLSEKEYKGQENTNRYSVKDRVHVSEGLWKLSFSGFMVKMPWSTEPKCLVLPLFGMKLQSVL